MGRRFGPWQIVADLDQGGQGWLYRVRHINTGEIGALKRLKNIARQARFEREFKALERVSHDNIVRVLDADVKAEEPFIVMEFVDGRSLGKISVLELECTPLRIRIDWFLQILAAVVSAHSKGVVHRDLKPENILIGTDGRVRVCDFGLAFIDDEGRLTETLEQVGSRFYMAPECEEGRSEVIGNATDAYSLGKILYYLVSGGNVFPREQHRSPRYDLARVKFDPYLEGFSRVLDSVIVQDPKKRMEDVGQMANDVRGAMTAQEGRFPVAGAQETYRCIFCRTGIYEQVFPASGASAHNLGYFDEGNIGGENFVFLECKNCGNAQRFKIKYGGKRWFP